MNHRPIFVLGNPRSGTTLLRMLITSHHNLVIPPECGFALWLQREYSQWTTQDALDAGAVNRFLQSLNKCRKYETWNLPDGPVRDQILNRCPANYAGLVECVYQAYRHNFKSGAKRWGDKNNFHVQHVDNLVQLFPDAQFVHIVRDVRDVACSYREVRKLDSKSPYRPNLPDEMEPIGDEWLSNVAAVQDSFGRMAGGASMTVRYEDIVRDTQANLTRICDFLNESFDPAMTGFYQQELEPAQTMDWKKKTRSPVSDEQVGRFRQELSPAELALLAQKCQATLELFGYPVP